MITLFQELRINNTQIFDSKFVTPYFNFCLHSPHLSCAVALLLPFVKYMLSDLDYKIKQEFSLNKLLVCAANILNFSSCLYINCKLQDIYWKNNISMKVTLYFIPHAKNTGDFMEFYIIYLNSEWEPGNYNFEVWAHSVIQRVLRQHDWLSAS